MTAIPQVAQLPPQTRRRRTAAPSDLGDTLQKAIALFGVHILTSMLVPWCVLALGPSLVGALLLLAAGYWFLATARDAEMPPTWGLVAVLEIALLASAFAWSVFADELTVSWWPAVFGKYLHGTGWGWRLVPLVASVAWLTVYPKVTFRLSSEITDPGWLAARRDVQYGPVGPYSRFASWELPEMPEPEVRNIRRPYPVYQQQLANDVQGAPSGREVSNADLRAFVHGAYRHGTAFINVWRRRGWSEDRWRDVVDVLTIYGITSEVKERMKTHLLLPTEKEAVEYLERNFR